MPGTFYTVCGTGAPGAGFWGYISPSASVRAALWHWYWSEIEASANTGRVRLDRTTGGTVTSQTPEKCDIDSAAASSTGATTGSLNPTQSGQDIFVVGVRDELDPVGNVRQWYAHPRFPLLIDLSGQITGFRAPDCARFLVFSEPQAAPVRDIRRWGRVRGYWHLADQWRRCQNPTTRVSGSGSEFTMLQAETWPESFNIPFKAALFAAPAAPMFDDEEALFHYHVVNW